MGFDGFQVIEFLIWQRTYEVFYRFWWLRSVWICDLDANLHGNLWVLMAWEWLNLRFDCEFTWKFMGFDGFQVIEFAVWLRIYVVFYRFWWLRSAGICDLDVNLRELNVFWWLPDAGFWCLPGPPPRVAVKGLQNAFSYLKNTLSWRLARSGF